MIGIINYGMGNLRSVQKAFEHLDVAAQILDQPDQAMGMSRLVLPGVGAFADGMRQLDAQAWTPAIHDFVRTGKPLLGICLGMQLLFDGSQEDASPEGVPAADRPVPGLSLLPGQVVRFEGPAFGPGKLKVPHMGWNQLQWDGAPRLFNGLTSGGDAVYFVHSYYPQPSQASHVLARCDYGGPFAAVVGRDNLVATQFHPEKSQRVGLVMLKNFADMD